MYDAQMLRRELHQMPELERNLPETLSFVEEKLCGLGVELSHPSEGALCAFFDFGVGRSAAFRADMDALPIAEKSGLPFASRNPGRMHACGHDGHTAMLLTLASALAEGPTPPRDILLIFQPAEETTGGAEAVCRSGILKKYGVSALFGQHIWPGLELGRHFSRPGPMMAQSCEVKVKITGKSAHIARQSEGRDALRAAVEFIDAVYAAEGQIEADQPRLLRFGSLNSGTTGNVISAESRISGSMRVYSDEMERRLIEILDSAAARAGELCGCGVEVARSNGYPPLLNDGNLFERVGKHLGGGLKMLDEPSLTTEDFSFYGREVPSLFFFLGAGDAPPLHSNSFNFDESILESGVALFERLARAPAELY